MVVGAYALAIHGRPRATGDLDVWVDATSENAPRAFAALRDFGAPLHDLGVQELSRPGIVYQIGLPPLRIDVLTAIDGVAFRAAWRRRIIADFDGVEVRSSDEPTSSRTSVRPADSRIAPMPSGWIAGVESAPRETARAQLEEILRRRSGHTEVLLEIAGAAAAGAVAAAGGKVGRRPRALGAADLIPDTDTAEARAELRRLRAEDVRDERQPVVACLVVAYLAALSVLADLGERARRGPPATSSPC